MSMDKLTITMCITLYYIISNIMADFDMRSITLQYGRLEFSDHSFDDKVGYLGKKREGERERLKD